MTSDPKVKAKRPKVRGLKMPRLATPRLGLSTKGMPAKHPYGANKMTVKTGSLAAYRYETLLEKQASGSLTLREFVQLREIEKQANLGAGISAVGKSVVGAGRRIATATRGYVARMRGRMTPRGPAAIDPPTTFVNNMPPGSRVIDPPTTFVNNMPRGSRVMDPPTMDTDTIPAFNPARRLPPASRLPPAGRAPPTADDLRSAGRATSVGASAVDTPTTFTNNMPTRAPAPAPARSAAAAERPTVVSSERPTIVSDRPTVVSPVPQATATTTPTTPKADGILEKTLKMAPVGVAGGLTAYGGLRGWGSGQAEVARAQQQSFNPRGVF